MEEMTNDWSPAVPIERPELVWDRRSLLCRCQIDKGYSILETQGMGLEVWDILIFIGI